jgi:hypothetical protein
MTIKAVWMAREVIAGIITEGILKLLPESEEDEKKCQHHPPHIPHLKCGQQANYELVRTRGANLNLCTFHARELRQRSDNRTK